MKKQSGFTLVELLIAAAFLAFIIMFATLAYVQINRTFNRGITVKRTQESTRDIIQDISGSIQATSYSSTGASVQFAGTGDGGQAVCLDDIRYIWYEGPRNGYSPEPESSIYKDLSFPNGCSEDRDGNETAMLDPKLMIQDLNVASILSSIAFKIDLIVSINENTPDLLSGSGATAKCNVLNGDQYCAVASLSTVVTLRR